MWEIFVRNTWQVGGFVAAADRPIGGLRQMKSRRWKSKKKSEKNNSSKAKKEHLHDYWHFFSAPFFFRHSVFFFISGRLFIFFRATKRGNKKKGNNFFFEKRKEKECPPFGRKKKKNNKKTLLNFYLFLQVIQATFFRDWFKRFFQTGRLVFHRFWSFPFPIDCISANWSISALSKERYIWNFFRIRNRWQYDSSWCTEFLDP